MDDDDFLRFVGSQARVKTRVWGEITFESAKLSPAVDGDLVVYVGKPLLQEAPLIRIHSECVFGEAFGSVLCDCAEQFTLAMQRLRKEGHGILFYLRLDGRGAGLAAKTKATALEVQGVDTYESRIAIGVKPEGRNFLPVADFLLSKGVKAVRLLTNNPDKATGLMRSGIHVTVEPLVVSNPTMLVRKLYETKRIKFGHSIPKELSAEPQLKFDFD